MWRHFSFQGNEERLLHWKRGRGGRWAFGQSWSCPSGLSILTKWLQIEFPTCLFDGSWIFRWRAHWWAKCKSPLAPLLLEVKCRCNDDGISSISVPGIFWSVFKSEQPWDLIPTRRSEVNWKCDVSPSSFLSISDETHGFGNFHLMLEFVQNPCLTTFFREGFPNRLCTFSEKYDFNQMLVHSDHRSPTQYSSSVLQLWIDQTGRFKHHPKFHPCMMK